MNRKIFATVILLIAVFFPFRYAFLEHPPTVLINGQAVEQHALRSMIFFLLFFASFMFWLYAVLSDSKSKQYEKPVERSLSQGKEAA